MARNGEQSKKLLGMTVSLRKLRCHFIRNFTFKMASTRKQMEETTSTITLTFGDQAENHVGMEKIGELSAPGMGFNKQDLEDIKERFEALGVTCLLHHLGDDAYLLVIQQAVDVILAEIGESKESFFKEQAELNVDKHALMYGRVVKKHARWNLCFDENGHEPDYENGKGRVISLSAVPITAFMMKKFPELCGPKAKNLKGEGNYYYDVKKCGVGYHGDEERRKVIAIRLGASNPIHYQWYLESKPIREHMQFNLDGGDMYIMSEKAVGTDWKRRKEPTLRHAVGPEKFTKVSK